ncbi:MAG TPA: hypothetical protein DEP72_03800 [Clostridiales bacterium]|nr:MAG: hypothetical protein A2Y18_05270 [Clostridiales bacterium GWD2_32_19]HCC07278.1 hypothetical protein [Clostridiales bacterium]
MSKIEFKERFKEEIKTKSNVLIHSDLDAALSSTYLMNKEKHLKLKGVFDINCFNTTNKLYLTEEKLHKDEDVFVDLAVSQEGCMSIDHHMKFSYDAKDFNVNRLNPKTSNIRNDLNNFHSKCPLNTIILLLWVYGENLLETFNYKQRLLIYAADSVWENYKNYRDNFTTWCEYLGLEYILEELESIKPEEIEEVKKEIYIHKSGYVHFNYNVNEFYTEKTKISLQQYLDNVCEFMCWDSVDVPEFEWEYLFDKRSVSYETFDALDKRKLFVSAIPKKQRQIEVLMYDKRREIKKLHLVDAGHL